MLVCIIAISLLIIGIIVLIKSNYREWLIWIGSIFSIIGIAVSATSFVVLIGIYATTPADKIEVQNTYSALVYQIDNKFYNNENEVGKFNLIQEITKFNTERKQTIYYHNSPWVNWFVPNIYTDIPEIPIPEYLTK